MLNPEPRLALWYVRRLNSINPRSLMNAMGNAKSGAVNMVEQGMCSVTIQCELSAVERRLKSMLDEVQQLREVLIKELSDDAEGGE